MITTIYPNSPSPGNENLTAADLSDLQRRLLELIERAAIPGRYPPATDLARELDVSPGAIRYARRRLELAGLLVISRPNGQPTGLRVVRQAGPGECT